MKITLTLAVVAALTLGGTSAALADYSPPTTASLLAAIATCDTTASISDTNSCRNIFSQNPCGGDSGFVNGVDCGAVAAAEYARLQHTTVSNAFPPLPQTVASETHTTYTGYPVICARLSGVSYCVYMLDRSNALGTGSTSVWYKVSRAHRQPVKTTTAWAVRLSDMPGAYRPELP